MGRIALILVAIVVLMWGASSIFGGPEGLSDADLAQDLRSSVAIVVGDIEAFRAQEGRLPELAELIAEDVIDPELDDGMEYVRIGEASYVVRLMEEGLIVEYDGSVPLELWVAGDGAISP